MRKLVFGLLVLAFVGFVTLPVAFADSTSLQESLFVIDGSGTTYHNNFTVPGINAGGFDQTTGVGTLTFVVSGAGAHSFGAYFDHELTGPSGDFFNEYGVASGVPSGSQSWQIDDPTFGNIFANTQGNALDNTNHIPGTTDNSGGGCGSVYDAGCAASNDDVSMAMGFNFVLSAGQTEFITLVLSHNSPGAGFFLHQIHPVDGCDPTGANCVNPSQLDLYFSGSAVTRGGGPPPSPEPTSLLLALVGTPFALAFRVLRQKLSRAS
jgi:hypothetical protein